MSDNTPQGGFLEEMPDSAPLFTPDFGVEVPAPPMGEPISDAPAFLPPMPDSPMDGSPFAASPPAPAPSGGLPTGLPTAPSGGLPTGLPTGPSGGLPTGPAPVSLPNSIPNGPSMPAPINHDLLDDLDSLDDTPDFNNAPSLAPSVSAPAVIIPESAQAPSTVVGAPAVARPSVNAPYTPTAAAEPGIVELDDIDLIEEEGEFVNLDDVLLYMLENGGSDLHLSVGSPPMIRVRGDMEPVPGYSLFTPKSLTETMYAVLSERQKQKFEETKELDFAHSLPGAARFRVNMFQQKGGTGAVLRTIPWEIKSLDELGMPAILGSFADLPRGLVLVTGPTGSGKSTTLAAIIDKANRTRPIHIMTIEDPIEFVHQHRMAVVNQREVGEDTWSFQNALKHALRQDPDIILVGEMRDLETISIALTAAETGHLVFGTLHTSSAASTIDRIIDVFPPEQQSQIRAQLGGSLQAVVCQALCKTADGKGRVAALEIMIATPAIRNLIREGKLQSIPSALQTGSKFGMQTLNQHLSELVKANTITYDMAREKASDVSELNQMLGRPQESTN